MLAFANAPVRTHVFNPDTSGLSEIERITTLLHYGGISWGAPADPDEGGMMPGGWWWPDWRERK